MKRVSKPVFFIVALLILVFSYAAIFGVAYYTGDNPHVIFKGIGDIRWGIDIRGGVEATFKPAKDVSASREELDSAKAIIETRMVSGGITDYELYADYGTNRIIVRFPWKSEETEYDPLEAIKEISATAELTFRPGKSYADVGIGSDGKQVFKTPTGETDTVLLTGSAIKSARAYVDTSNGSVNKYGVGLEFTAEGSTAFEQITTEYKGQTISIWMDNVMLSYPTVENVISGGSGSITGNFTAEEATKLANQINAGALPFALETSSYGTINPTLGLNSLTAMAYAGGIALIIVSIFMLIIGRLQGVIAIIALIGQMGLSVAAVSRFFPVFDSFTMTLPGIAGIILSVGMGVDANIITSARVKEEVIKGKTVSSAVDRGTKNSLSAIVDGNMTVIIVSVILLLVFGPSNILSWLFGASTVGEIYAFGYTLLMGVIANFIMGITFTRLMLQSIANYKFAKNRWLFGGAKNES